MNVRAAAAQRGQATVELVAAIPVLLLAALVALALLAAGHARSLAEGAAKAGALARAAGTPPRAAALDALPEAAREAARVAVAGGRVRVELPVATPLAAAGLPPPVEAAAWARGPGSRRR